MKKLVSPLPAGLMPLFKSDLTIMQDNVYAAMLSVIKGIELGYSFVLQGMTASIVGSNLVITSGYWWRHDSNEIIYFPGATLVASLAGSVTKTGTTTYTKVYKDGSTQTVYNESISGASASLIAPSPPTNAINYNGITASATLLSVILASINKNTAWANATFQNSWANNSSAESVQYRKNSNGMVLIRGIASHSGAVSTTIFTLPVGYRPPRDTTFRLCNLAGTELLVFIGADGQVIPATETNVRFDGLIFTID